MQRICYVANGFVDRDSKTFADAWQICDLYIIFRATQTHLKNCCAFYNNNILWK